MSRSHLGIKVLPLLGLALSCAKAVDQGFVGDDDDDSGGGISVQGGQTHSAGTASSSGGQTSSAGKTSAFGGTASSGTGGSIADGGGNAGGTPGGGAAGTSNGGQASGGTAGSSGAGGKTGGSGGASGGGGLGGGGGKGGGGAGGGGAGGGGAAGSGGSGGGNSGDCAPAGTGWVVQYWTSTPAANMPAGDVRIFNNAGGSVNFNTLELRHYFTNEETATLSFIFSTFGHNFPAAPYYEDEGGANVVSSIVNLVPAATNASQYISIKFNATPGSFGNGENAQLGYYGSLSMYPLKSNQNNDYTYANHPQNDPGSANKNVGWDHITLYAGGKLVWGCEP